MKWLLFSFCILYITLIQAQVGVVSQNTFFKDRYFYDSQTFPAYKSNGIFPVSVKAYDLPTKIADTTLQYYWFTEVLFKTHLVNIKGKNFHIKATPVFDLSIGKDILDTNRFLFQNTRGLHIEVDLFKNFTFTTSVYENQSRHNSYETQYYQSVGERYYSSNGYYKDNAVIPGFARTKPFKGNGFDYGVAFGEINYQPHKSIFVAAGNGQRFIGDGYRSILYSDNSIVSPFLQVSYDVNPQLKIFNYRSKLTNLLRRPDAITVEANYEPKLSSINYISLQATEKWNIALFEGIMYSKGDSVHTQHVHPLYYNPVPILGALLAKNTFANAIIGLNTSYQFKQIHVYGQFAVNPQTKGTGAQLGARYYPLTGQHFLMLQLEGNLTTNLYRSENPRLNFSNFNLPIAHIKGDRIKEIILRASYEYKRIFIELKSILYGYSSYSPTALLPLYEYGREQNGWQNNTQIEFGYRFNRKVNFNVFGSFGNVLIRTDITNYSSAIFSFGIRTGLINSYKDF